jgi:hypothetical protein
MLQRMPTKDSLDEKVKIDQVSRDKIIAEKPLQHND